MRALSLLSLVLALAAAPASAQWVEQSPHPTGLAVHDVVFVSSNHGFLATENSQWDEQGALFETYDGAASWTARTTPAAPDGINALFFYDDQRGWAVGNTNYRTTDGGQTWQQLPFLGSAYFVRFYTPTFGLTTGNFGRYVSHDGGLSWVPSPNDMFAFSFADAQVGLGVSASGVYRTTNGGQTFSQVRSGSASAVAFLTSTVAVAVVGDEFLRSTDAGQTWAVTAPAQGRNRLQPVSGSVILAWRDSGTTPSTDGRLLRSADGGQTWTDLGTVFADSTGAFEVLGAQTVVATDQGGDVFRSTDAGQTWARTFDAPFTGYGKHPMDFADALHGWLAYGYGLVFETNDGGVTWEQISNGYGADLYDLAKLTDQRLIAVGYDGTVLVTDDGGANWDLVEDGVAEYHDNVAVDNVGTEFVALVTRFGMVITSADGGREWNVGGTVPIRYGDFFAYDVEFVTPQEGWVVGLHSEFPFTQAVWHTTDGGQTWTNPVATPPDEIVVGVDVEGERVWAITDAGYLSRSADAGQTWTQGYIPDPNGNIAVLDLEFADANTGYAVGGYGYLAKTTNGGATWAVLPTPDNTHTFTDLYLVGPNDVWMSALPDRVYHSTDGGQTWDVDVLNSRPLAFDDFQAVAATASGSAWTVGFKGYIYAQNPPPPAPVAVSAAPVGGPIAIGPSGGSFQYTVTLTNTTGQPQTFQAWTAVTGPVGREPVAGPQTVTLPAGATLTRTLRQQVPANAPAGTYTYHVRLGAFPAGVTSSDSFTFTKQAGTTPREGAAVADWAVSGTLGADEAAAASATLPEGFTLSEARPNPFARQATLTLEVAEAQAVRVAVYDGLGRRVAVLADGEVQAGAHALVLDGSALPAGVYVVRVTGETFSATRRATLVR